MKLNLDGRVVLVTGASRGIGAAMAKALGAHGASVVVNYHGSRDKAEAVLAAIRSSGGDGLTHQADVRDAAAVDAMVAAAIGKFGKVDVLINNAGIMRNTALEETSDEDWDVVIATHLTGSFKLTRAVWPHMKAQGYGRIVYTASSAGLFGNPLVGGYGAAKAGIAGLMHVAALEGKGQGILCNAIMPNAASRMAMQAAADWTGRLEGIDAPLPESIGNSMNVEFNTPLAVYLASEACQETQGLFSQCLGRTAHVFIGAVTGWQAQRQSPPSVDDVAAHWGEICDSTRGYVVPHSAGEELAAILSRD